MSTILASLDAVRYYTALDPYNWQVDNRPLSDLRSNVEDIAAETDRINLTKNLLSRAMAEVQVTQALADKAIGTFAYQHPVTTNPMYVNYSSLIMAQMSSPIPVVGVIRDIPLDTHHPGVIGPFTTPTAGQVRTFLIEARVTDYLANEPLYSTPDTDLGAENHVGGIEFNLKTYPSDQATLPKDDPALLYPSVTSGWVGLHRLAVYSDTASITHDLNVIDLSFSRSGLIDASSILASNAPSYGMVPVFGRKTATVTADDHSKMVHWDYPVPLPDAAGKTLVSTGTGYSDYEWEYLIPAAASAGLILTSTGTNVGDYEWSDETIPGTLLGTQLITSSSLVATDFPGSKAVIMLVGGGAGGGGGGGGGGDGPGGAGGGGGAGNCYVVELGFVPDAWTATIGVGGAGGAGGASAVVDNYGGSGANGQDGGTTYLSFVADGLDTLPGSTITLSAEGGKKGYGNEGGDINDWSVIGPVSAGTNGSVESIVISGSGFATAYGWVPVPQPGYTPAFYDAGVGGSPLAQYTASPGGVGALPRHLENPAVGDAAAGGVATGSGTTIPLRDGANATVYGGGGGGGAGGYTQEGSPHRGGNGGAGMQGAILVAYYAP